MADLIDRERPLAALRSSALFSHLDEITLANVAERLTSRRFRRGEVVFHEGDPGDALHIVVAGRVKIGRLSPGGGEAIVASLGPGEVFGELVLLDGAPRSASATALEATDTLTLDRSAFVALVDGDPAFRWALFAGIADHHRRLTDQLAETHFLDLAGRLARQLARLARSGRPVGDGISLGRLYTQSELAAMIGGTRPRVNRLIGELIDDGLIRIEVDDIVITDVAALEQRATW
jgi:CRP/FNR family transcriptional regulator